MTPRRSVSSGTRWEEMAGYCRALRVGNVIHVAGTTATDENGVLVGGNDPAAQARYAIQKIERAIGWRPTTSLDETIDQIVDYFRANGLGEL